MNDLIVLAFAVIMLLAMLPMFLMSRAFKGAGRREKGASDASIATMAAVDGPTAKPKTGHDPDDSSGEGGGDGADGGGGGD